MKLRTTTNRITVDGSDSIAGLEARALRGATGGDDRDHRTGLTGLRRGLFVARARLQLDAECGVRERLATRDLVGDALRGVDRDREADAAGNPASMTSTPSVSSCRASRSFSSGDRLLPGACSPSRRVVSKIRTSEIAIRGRLVGKRVKRKSAADLQVRGAGAFGRDSTVSRCSCRHAAGPSLTDKDGKQDAKDEDEHEVERHRVFWFRELGADHLGG